MAKQPTMPSISWTPSVPNPWRSGQAPRDPWIVSPLRVGLALTSIVQCTIDVNCLSADTHAACDPTIATVS